MDEVKNMDIIKVTDENAKMWAELCNELWPHNSVHEMLEAFNSGEYKNEYLCQIDGLYVAFLSLSVRSDYVEGKTDSKPVGYLEGIYVKPEYRKRGIAKALVEFAQKWVSEKGCSMLASDCELSNEDSRIFHNKIGFVEASINVHFKMELEQ